MLRTVTVQSDSAHGWGRLAEAAVYFPRSRWVIGTRQLANLVLKLGWAPLHDFLDVSGVEFVMDRFSVGSQNQGALISVALVSLAGHGRLAFEDAEEECQYELLRKLGITRANRAEIDRLLPRLDLNTTVRMGGEATLADMTNEALTTAVATQLAADHGLPAGTFYRFRPDESALLGATWRPETDFFEASPAWAVGGEVVGPEAVARSIYSMTREVVRSADGRTDLWLPPQTTSALRAKINTLAVAADDRRRDIDTFEDHIFDKRSIAAAVDNGERSFDDVIRLLADPETQRWKQWLHDQPPDVRLLRAYDEAVFAPKPQFSGLGWEAARIVGMTGASALLATATGAVGLVASAAVGAAQEVGATLASRVAQRLAPPWRPSQWTKGPARDFLR